jgi:hypothetical protein
VCEEVAMDEFVVVLSEVDENRDPNKLEMKPRRTGDVMLDWEVVEAVGEVTVLLVGFEVALLIPAEDSFCFSVDELELELAVGIKSPRLNLFFLEPFAGSMGSDGAETCVGIACFDVTEEEFEASIFNKESDVGSKMLSTSSSLNGSIKSVNINNHINIYSCKMLTKKGDYEPPMC